MTRLVTVSTRQWLARAITSAICLQQSSPHQDNGARSR